MISHNPEHDLEGSFQVRVGYTTVTVKGLTRRDAIEQAREQLCLEMPRMWDVIQSLEHHRFEVFYLK